MELSENVKMAVEAAKAAGNPVLSVKLGDVTYLYKGLLRGDLEEIRKQSQEVAIAYTKEHESMLKDDHQVRRLASNIDDLEDDVFVSYAIIDPVIALADIKKMPMVRAKTLKELILRASGDGELVAEPVRL